MSDTVKLIIEIPKPIYDRIKYLEPNADTMLDNLMRAVQNGIPLDDVKAEIERVYDDCKTGDEDYDAYISRVFKIHHIDKDSILQILDNIGKTESEGE